MDFLERKYTSKQVAAATGVAAKDIQNWSSRGLITGFQSGAGRGHAHHHLWYAVMEIAVASTLMDIGVKSPNLAFRASLVFSHVSDDEGRHPGFPHHQNLGETYLFLSGEFSSILVQNDPGHLDLSEAHPRIRQSNGFITINLSQVFRNVCERIGVHPHEILDQVYPEDAS